MSCELNHDDEHSFKDVFIAQSKHLAKHDQNKFDLITRKVVTPPVKVRRQASIREAMATTLAEATGVPVEHQRLWRFHGRRNKTTRVDRPLNEDELNQQFEAFILSRRREHGYKMLYLEDMRETGATPTAPATDDASPSSSSSSSSSSPLLLFIKYYDPATQTVEFAGSHSFNPAGDDTVQSLVSICNRLKGFPEDTPLSFWEEETADVINPLSPDFCLGAGGAKLQAGDIVVFAKTLTLAEHDELALSDPPAWYLWKRHSVKIRFRKLETPGDETGEFSLELSKKMTYSEVAIRVAKHLGLEDHNKLRFTGLTSHSNQPRFDPCRPTDNLKDMTAFFFNGPSTDVLFYEILPFTLAEIDQLKQLTVALQNARCQVAKSIKVFVQKSGTVADVVATARSCGDPDTFTFGTGKFRVLELWSSKIHSIMAPEAPIARKDSWQSLVLEELSPDEVEMEKDDMLVKVSHFELSHFNNPTYFGHPFFFVIKAGETAGALKGRIQARLGIADEEFSKWRLVQIGYATCKRLADEQDLAALELGPQFPYGHLGLEHLDDNVEMPT